jgi:hypothetical protein
VGLVSILVYTWYGYMGMGLIDIIDIIDIIDSHLGRSRSSRLL